MKQHLSPEYVLRSSRPQQLSHTTIRYRGTCRPGWTTSGNVEASIDGGKWAKIGSWNTAAIDDARDKDDWHTVSLRDVQSNGKATEIRVRFVQRGGEHSLAVSHVVWKSDSAQVVGKPDAKASPVTSQPASIEDAPSKTATGPALEKPSSGNVAAEPDSAHVVGKLDSEASPATSQPASPQDIPTKAATSPAPEEQQQDRLLVAKQRKLEQLQKDLERLHNSPAPRGKSSAQQRKVRAKRLEELQGQIAKVQEEIEAADAKTSGGESGQSGNETVANTPLPHLNRYTPETTPREMAAYPLTIRLMGDKVLQIFNVPDRDRAMEARRLLRVGIRANIPDKLLPLFVLKGIEKGKSKHVSAFTSAQIVRESLEFVAACGFQGPPPEAIDADHPRLGGVWDVLRGADETLRFNIVPSETFNQLAATVRIGTEIGFKGSTEAAEILKALKEGRPYYRFQGRDGCIDLGYGSRWSKVMAAGSGLTAGMPMASEWLGAHSSNSGAARNWPLIALARTLQWDIDVAPHLLQEVALGTRVVTPRLSNRELGENADVFVGLIRRLDHSAFGDRQALLANLNVALKGKINGRQFKLAEKDIPKYTTFASDAAEKFANKVGYDSLASMLALHNPKYLFAVTSTFDSDNEQGSEHDKAITDYTEANRSDLKNAEAYTNRGATYSEKGEHNKAIADFTEAIRLNPNVADGYVNRAVAYRRKGDRDKAIADCTEAIRLDPKNARAYNDRGVDYASQNRTDEAAADLLKAKKLGFFSKAGNAKPADQR